MRKHELKSWPEPWRDVVTGAKSYEVRADDRGIVVGDFLVLREWDARYSRYTGWAIEVEVVHLTRGAPPSPLPAGVVVLGIRVASEPFEFLPGDRSSAKEGAR